MMIIVLVIIVLCCVVTAGIFGLVYFMSNSTSDSLNTIVDRVVTTTDVDDAKAPTMADVEKAYLAADSYDFEGTIDWGDGDIHKISGSFVSPNNETYLTIDSVGTIDEVMLNGSTYYINYDKEGWEEIDEPFNAGVQRDELKWVLALIDADTVGKSTSGGWTFKFYDEEYGEDWTLDVNNSHQPIYLRLEYIDEEGLTVVEEIHFSDYNNPNTEVVAPI